MTRREFITLVGGTALAWPLVAHAQQPDRVRRIGMLILYSQTDREGQARIAAFLDTLQKLGWTDGRNVRIEYRWIAGDFDRDKASVAELVRSTPDLIVVSGWTALAELHRLTSTIPVVFTQVSDPVGSGFVASLARPGAYAASAFGMKVVWCSRYRQRPERLPGAPDREIQSLA